MHTFWEHDLLLRQTRMKGTSMAFLQDTMLQCLMSQISQLRSVSPSNSHRRKNKHEYEQFKVWVSTNSLSSIPHFPHLFMKKRLISCFHFLESLAHFAHFWLEMHRASQKYGEVTYLGVLVYLPYGETELKLKEPPFYLC